MTERAIIRALSLFSGAGGLDMGARIADVRVPLATDSDESALAVHNAALGTRTLVGDITRLLEGELQRAWGSVAPDIVLGGPPCTAFSHAGFWIEGKREGRDPAALVLRAYLRAVETFKPAAFLMENVPGLTFKTHRATFEATLKAARRLGYTTSWTILNARNFGVPQARRRLFLAGIRGSSAVSLDDWPNFPERTPAWAFADLTTEPEDG
ncbi:MAG: DNA cytosine methyltransferase [Chloroflexota bacterium]